MRAAFLLIFACACGGAASSAPPIATTTTPVASSPPLFTGPFDVESMSDGKETLVVADVMRKGKAHAGRMTWEIGADKLKIGMWTMSELDKIAETDTDPNRYAEFCRASGEVAAHWEGATLVLGSTIVVEGSGGVIRILKKSQGASTTRDETKRIGNCSASFTDTRVTFEIVDKDDSGPARVRAKAKGVTLVLVRGAPIATIDPSKLFE